MSIELNLKTKSKTKIHTYNLREFLGDPETFFKTVHKDMGVKNDFTGVDIVDSHYFTSIIDVKDFLSIKFDYDTYASPFLEWVKMTNSPFNDITNFLKVFKGVFNEAKDFAKEYIEHNYKTNAIPKYVQEAIDWQRVWDTHLSKQFLILKVEDNKHHGVSIYIHAVFDLPNPNSKM